MDVSYQNLRTHGTNKPMYYIQTTKRTNRARINCYVYIIIIFKKESSKNIICYMIIIFKKESQEYNMLHNSYFLMFVCQWPSLEGREVTCNLYACDKPCNISPNRTPLVYIHFWGLGRKSSPSMHFNNPKNFCRQSVTNHKSNNIVIAANPNLYNSMHFVKCVSLLDILNTKSLKESKCNFIHFPTNQCFLELRFLFSL